MRHPASSLTREDGEGSQAEILRFAQDDGGAYLHDGRLMTLDDTVEFFNLILSIKLTDQEKKDLIAFMRAL